MSELTSMKTTPAERKARYAPTSIGGGEKDGPLYPYGLTVQLDDESLEKLELEPLPKVGTVLTLVARVEVTAVASNQGADKEKHQSVSLQITDLCLEPESARKAVEDALYSE